MEEVEADARSSRWDARRRLRGSGHTVKAKGSAGGWKVGDLRWLETKRMGDRALKIAAEASC